ncbi:MAG: phosphodiester glycosidase family protein [Gemmatimonadetes bacterium]|nr:phosphodiester glycosidase family protein [Gemmatimonadota bacterium]
MMLRRGVVLVALLSGCAAPGALVPRGGALSGLPRFGDRQLQDTLARGVVLHRLVVDSAPWAIQILDIDRRACWSLGAVKAGGAAVGRAKTTELLVKRGPGAIAAVNADFFLFAPPGVPQAASIEGGRLIAGPSVRPVVAITPTGAPWLGVLAATGQLVAGVDTIPITSWNRPSPNGLAWYDANWGSPVDTASGTLRLSLGAGPLRRVLAVDSSGRATTIPRDGGVLVVGRTASAAMRRTLLEIAPRGIVVSMTLAPFAPTEAVGGFPMLLRDSAEVAGLEAAGGANFGPVRHPRTLVGVAAGGRRLLLVTVDGRQPGYSMGMTLRESAVLMRALGATEAINLDGGGSTAMALRNGLGGAVLGNHPSDKEGERAVANALAVVRSCR